MTKIITSYENPDLDGVACSFAYSEFLSKINKEFIPCFFGDIHIEAQFVLDKLKINLLDGKKIINDVKEIIIVDCSFDGLSKKIEPLKVIEIIDHRKNNQIEMFPNAKVKIELVGSCATLIAEKFYNSKTCISKKSATLLYLAIVSNTINFKANVTTKRDIKISHWLKNQYNISDSLIKEMFLHKSNIKQNLKKYFLEEAAIFTFNSYKIGIVQIEILNSEYLIKKNVNEINEILNYIKKTNNLDIIFLTCVDIEKGFNQFIVIDNFTKEILMKILGLKFKDNYSKRKGIIMRKEISPILNEFLISLK
jgi:manganese-dependent inorganic pyrophosphatase